MLDCSLPVRSASNRSRFEVSPYRHYYGTIEQARLYTKYDVAVTAYGKRMCPASRTRVVLPFRNTRIQLWQCCASLVRSINISNGKGQDRKCISTDDDVRIASRGRVARHARPVISKATKFNSLASTAPLPSDSVFIHTLAPVPQSLV